LTESTPLTPDESHRLTLANSDMRQAAAAARLLETQTDFHTRSALETAISVCYARPWLKSNQLGKLKDKWLPTTGADRDLHELLLDLRHKTYAHTDPAGGRKAILDSGGGVGEERLPLRRDLVPAIFDLCNRQAARFMQALTGAAASG
jgi:hypothetical protein